MSSGPQLVGLDPIAGQMTLFQGFTKTIGKAYCSAIHDSNNIPVMR